MRRIGVLLAALLLAGAASGSASGHPSRAELDEVEREQSRMAALLEGAADEVREAGQTLAESEALLPGAEHAADEAAGRVAAAEAVAAEARGRSEAARSALEAARAEHEAAAAAVERAREARAEVLAAAHRGVELLAIDAVITSEDTSQALDRMTYLEFMIEGKHIAVEEVALERRKAAEARDGAAAAEVEAAAAEAAAQEALEAATARYAEAEAARAQVARLVEARAEALETAEAAEAEARARYEELEAESERLAASLRAEGPPADGSAGSSGEGFTVPVDGWKSSDFGWRRHPIFGDSRFHGGTDFAAGHGASIYAADSGTVAYAGWNGGYGMLTCVSHGGGVSSCYAHQSAIHVAEGDRVTRGQKIGAVGTTGTSTGAHLHFEVRVKGERVDPLGYLPACLCRL